ncbi:MAG: ATP-binding protein [Bacteroidota bacterium]
MIRKDVLKEIIVLNQNTDFSSVLKRDSELPLDSGKIISVTGVRRCGKTYLLLHGMKNLLERKIDKSNLVYINFEDERLYLETGELDLILQAYMELYPDNELKNVYFFFDEIQNLPGWEKFVRRLYDTVSRHIIITGSNSKMLGSDIAGSLRGRNINIELFPLSFREYLQFKNIDNNLYLPAGKAVIINSMRDYLINGGFPEVINTGFHQKILQDYFYVMLYKDLIERYNIKNVAALKYFLNRIVISTGKPASIHKIYNELKSAGYKISKDSLYLFADYAETAYFSFRLSKFNYSFIKQEQSEKKIYFIDNGLLNSLTWQFSDNFGSLLENVVFLHLHRRYRNNLFFYKEQTECDFVVFDKDKPADLIQVSYDISNKATLAREISGLENAAEYFNIRKGKIITLDSELETFISSKGVEIETIPVYKWLLQEGS